jgi:hypothetical protein
MSLEFSCTTQANARTRGLYYRLGGIGQRDQYFCSGSSRLFRHVVHDRQCLVPAVQCRDLGPEASVEQHVGTKATHGYVLLFDSHGRDFCGGRVEREYSVEAVPGGFAILRPLLVCVVVHSLWAFVCKNGGESSNQQCAPKAPCVKPAKMDAMQMKEKNTCRVVCKR